MFLFLVPILQSPVVLHKESLGVYGVYCSPLVCSDVKDYIERFSEKRRDHNIRCDNINVDDVRSGRPIVNLPPL